VKKKNLLFFWKGGGKERKGEGHIRSSSSPTEVRKKKGKNSISLWEEKEEEKRATPLKGGEKGNLANPSADLVAFTRLEKRGGRKIRTPAFPF